MINLLDKKIIYYSIIKNDANGYDEDEKYEEILELLQVLRKEQYGKELDTFEIVNKINHLKDQAKIKRGELVRVGNMLIPSIERIKGWKSYSKISMVPKNG